MNANSPRKAASADWEAAMHREGRGLILTRQPRSPDHHRSPPDSCVADTPHDPRWAPDMTILLIGHTGAGAAVARPLEPADHSAARPRC